MMAGNQPELQTACDVITTSHGRRFNVLTSYQRPYNVVYNTKNYILILKCKSGGVSFCWIGIQLLYSQKNTPPHCFSAILTVKRLVFYFPCQLFFYYFFFRLLGSPNEENWPGVSKLPLFKVSQKKLLMKLFFFLQKHVASNYSRVNKE